MWGSKHTGHGDAFITSLRACCEADSWNAVLHCNLLNDYWTVHSSYIEVLRLGNRWNALYGSLNGCGAERRLWFRCVIVLYWFENTFAESVYVFWCARQMMGEECCYVVRGFLVARHAHYWSVYGFRLWYGGSTRAIAETRKCPSSVFVGSVVLYYILVLQRDFFPWYDYQWMH